MPDSDPLSHDQLLAQRRFVSTLARRLVHDAGAAEDVAQETFARALTAPPSQLRSLESWLRTVVHNVARQFGRGAIRRAIRENIAAAVHSSTAPATDVLAEQLELQRRLIERVLALPRIYKDVVLLHFYDERTVEQTASQLGIPLETARTRLRRALDELRTRWNGDLGGKSAGLLALVKLVPTAQIAVPTIGGAAAITKAIGGVLIVMSKTSKVALTAVLLLIVSGGGWLLWHEHPGTGGSSSNVGPRLEPTHVNTDEARESVAAERTVELEPATVAVPAAPAANGEFGSVRMRVTWAKDKSPIAGVPVRLMSEEHAPYFVDEVQGMTDEHGEFFAEQVPSGSVIAIAAGFSAFTGSSDQPQFFDRECARRIAVRAGETTEIDLSVWKEAEVHGLVVDPEGTPVEGATIWISNQPSWPSIGQEFGKSDSFGRFHLPVVEKIHHISAYAPGYAPSPPVALWSKEKDRQIELVLQLLDEGGHVRGRVVDSNRQPVEHAFVYLSGLWANPRVLRDGTYGEHPPARTTRTELDGIFDIGGAPLGAVHLVVRARGHAPAWEQFTLTADATKEMEISLQAGGVLTGTVSTSDDSPLHGIKVRVAPALPGLPEPRSEMLASVERTDEAGHFTLEHLVAAELEAVIDAGEEGTAKLAFRIAEGETREWHPVLSRGLEIHGLVVDEFGMPCAGWKIETRPEKYESGVEPPPEVSTNAEGRFTISRCGDKLYELRILEPDTQPFGACFSVLVLHEVKAGEEELRIEIPSSARSSAFVAGRVFDAEGQPVRSITLYLYKAGSSYNGFNAGGAHGFRLGPFPPGEYAMRLWLTGLPELELGTQTLTAGETLDLGTLTMPRPGFVEIRASRADGTPAEEGDLILWNEERHDSARISRMGDLLRSEPVAPGRYLLCAGQKMASVWMPFEVEGGQTVELAITVEPGASRSFQLLTASGQPPPAPVKATLSDAAGHTLWTHAWPHSGDRSIVISQRFARGRYCLSFTAADDTKGEIEFEVADLFDSSTPVDVTLH